MTTVLTKIPQAVEYIIPDLQRSNTAGYYPFSFDSFHMLGVWPNISPDIWLTLPQERDYNKTNVFLFKLYWPSSKSRLQYQKPVPDKAYYMPVESPTTFQQQPRSSKQRKRLHQAVSTRPRPFLYIAYTPTPNCTARGRVSQVGD